MGDDLLIPLRFSVSRDAACAGHVICSRSCSSPPPSGDGREDRSAVVLRGGGRWGLADTAAGDVS